MASVSMHKSGGSLTQSSFLLTGPDMNPGYVRQIINLTQTTSASYLLLASLDISRRNLALRGQEEFAKVIRLYFEQDGNIQKCAEKMFIHRNTFQYRMDTIQKKVGYSLKTPKEAMLLYLAIQ